jgi:hypothetical protein
MSAATVVALRLRVALTQQLATLILLRLATMVHAISARVQDAPMLVLATSFQTQLSTMVRVCSLTNVATAGEQLLPVVPTQQRATSTHQHRVITVHVCS